ncbi:MAG: hypothetical protein B6D63_05555 [Candidatus Latescibacteria bacterium 4484_7]|nr:MAG: hypothetical protein B6D63_05555 [Candidatus Latescibacteria bacterium 4484_7]
MSTAVIVLAVLAFVLGLGLAVAARIFAVNVDPRIEKITEILPGANCGGCGYAGCSDLAKAIVEGKAGVDACPVGSAEVAEKIAKIMGVELSGDKVRKVAIVLCSGDDQVASKKFYYNGIEDCASAALIFGGDKSCKYGCLGLGTCADVCPFDAIDMLPSGLARVDPERCTGCGKCVDACPKGIIKLVPIDRKVHVLCSSHDKGGKVRKICKVGCIGCQKCAKEAPEGAITMEENLAVVNYDIEIPESVAGVCPTHTIVIRGEHLEEVEASEEAKAAGGAV